jgi:hypothetical protein
MESERARAKLSWFVNCLCERQQRHQSGRGRKKGNSERTFNCPASTLRADFLILSAKQLKSKTRWRGK